MNAKQFVAALAVIGVVVLLVPEDLHAWTPATHIYLGKSVLSQVHQLAPAVAELLRAFPFDFLYGNIAADSSIAKSYAPVSRHCHHWHVGQEIYDHAPNDALRAFGLGYMTHLSADTVAHNYFVPRQLALTSSTASVGHAYWEARFEAHLGDAYAAQAKEIIQLDHTSAMPTRRKPRRSSSLTTTGQTTCSIASSPPRSSPSAPTAACSVGWST